MNETSSLVVGNWISGIRLKLSGLERVAKKKPVICAQNVGEWGTGRPSGELRPWSPFCLGDMCHQWHSFSFGEKIDWNRQQHNPLIYNKLKCCFIFLVFFA
jgi:hypothetical protein